MTLEDCPLTVLLDEGAPVSVAEPFLKAAHGVIYHADALESGADDQTVVATAILNKAALIAVDLDMKRYARRFGSPRSTGKYEKLDLIFLSCGEVMASKRLEYAMSFIENEWRIRCAKTARRLWVDIGAHRLTSYR